MTKQNHMHRPEAEVVARAATCDDSQDPDLPSFAPQTASVIFVFIFKFGCECPKARDLAPGCMLGGGTPPVIPMYSHSIPLEHCSES